MNFAVLSIFEKPCLSSNEIYFVIDKNKISAILSGKDL